MKISAKINGITFANVMALCLFAYAGCNNEAIYEEEQYKNIVYLLSGSENVFTESYTLNESEPVRYFSIGCGGSKPNAAEVTVTLEPDRVLLDQYNRNNFDVKVTSYAKLLPADRYQIASYTVTIPANPADQYVKVPVTVRPLGLSPDTIYFIPLAIKSVSRYSVNEDKHNLLYRVTIENDYATQKTVTYYTKKGTEKNQSTNAESILSGTKIVQPLTHDKVRLFTGNNVQNPTMTTVADIKKYAIVVQVKADESVDIFPYGTIEVEKLDAPDYNHYAIVKQGNRGQRAFFLYYRYRIRNDSGTFGSWMEVKETLTRVEEN
jgi:hypothetical protein